MSVRCRHHFVDAQDLDDRYSLFVCDRCGVHGGHPKTLYARGCVAGPLRGRSITVRLATVEDARQVQRILAARGRHAPATIYADLAPHWRRS